MSLLHGITLTSAEYVALLNDANAHRAAQSSAFKYKLLTRKDVEKITRMSRSSIYYAMKNSDFPKPIKIASGRGVVWLQNELEEWIEKRMSNRASIEDMMEDDA